VGDDVFRLVADPRLGVPLAMDLVITLDSTLFASLFSAYFGLFWLISFHIVLLNQSKSANRTAQRCSALPMAWRGPCAAHGLARSLLPRTWSV
jgi:hypothetical protein